jgi:hypothetical protein
MQTHRGPTLPVEAVWALFVLAHVPLALLMEGSPGVSTAHALVTAAVALWAALEGRFTHVLWTATYICAAEVLWRMTGAQLFWEFGKYALAAVLLIAFVRLPDRRLDLRVLLYFALLIPSAWLTISALSAGDARNELSFNLSGPLTLAISVSFFRNVTIPEDTLLRSFLAALAPVSGIAAIAARATWTGPVRFTTASNFATSGGFGPVQVSFALGLGILLALLLAMCMRGRPWLRLAMLVLVAAFGIQSAMTFSRSGLYSAGFAVLAGSLFLLRDLRAVVRLVCAAAALLIVGAGFLAPRLNETTGGALFARFRDTGLTGRDALALEDLRIWRENPVTGVGPGMAKRTRSAAFGVRAAHTEYSRMAAEHGLLGLASLGLLAWVGFSQFQRLPRGAARAVGVALATWALLFMATDGMRLAATGFLFGLAFVQAGRQFRVSVERHAVSNRAASPFVRPGSQPVAGLRPGYVAQSFSR